MTGNKSNGFKNRFANKNILEERYRCVCVWAFGIRGVFSGFFNIKSYDGYSCF